MLGKPTQTPARQQDFKLEVENAKAYGSQGAISIMNGVALGDGRGFAEMSYSEVKYQRLNGKWCLSVGEPRGTWDLALLHLEGLLPSPGCSPLSLRE